jgi:hypothetical protein
LGCRATKALPVNPACHSIRDNNSPVVAFRHGLSTIDSAEVPNLRPGVEVDTRLRNTNRACDMTTARTICAANAGGLALNADA